MPPNRALTAKLRPDRDGLTATERMPFMSLTRRLAAGLPAAGVTVLAALALAGSPAAALGDARAQQPAAMATPCSEAQRGQKCDYDTPGGQTPAETPADGAATPGDNGPTRGNGGYGTQSPTGGATTPTSPVTPTGDVNTVTPGGELPATSPAKGTQTGNQAGVQGGNQSGGGVSAGGTLPLTGAPLGLTISVGGVLVAAGAGAVLYGRRRRTA